MQARAMIMFINEHDHAHDLTRHDNNNNNNSNNNNEDNKKYC